MSTAMPTELWPMAPLQGKVIAVPETRQLETFALLLEERGARVLRCPLVAILDTPDSAPVIAWLKRLISGEFQDLILLTGEGFKRLMDLAKREGVEKEALRAFTNVRKITRGPKPARALMECGLRPDLSSDVHTTPGIIEMLKNENLAGRNVAVQLYGDDPNLAMMNFLIEAKANAIPVSPYRYAPAADAVQVADLIKKMNAGEVSAMTFTSSTQVRRMRDVAKEHKLETELEAGMKKTVIASIGPIATKELEAQGVRVDVQPKRSFFLKPMVKELELVLDKNAK